MTRLGVDDVRRFMVQAPFCFSSRRRHTRYWRDWSSDVCSSDLYAVKGVAGPRRLWERAKKVKGKMRLVNVAVDVAKKIGRASGRERVEISVVAVSLKKKSERSGSRS